MSAMRSASSTTTISTSSRLDLAPLDQVGEATRAGDEHVDAAPQRLELGAEAGAAVDRGDAELAATAEPLELTAHLGGELTGGHEYEGARAACGRALPTRATSGMPNAMVLPEPVGARPQRSRPARPSGTVMAWMSNASVRPRAWRVSTSSAGTPSSAKVVLGMTGCVSWGLCCGFGVSGGWTNPESTDPERIRDARDEYPLAKAPSAATTITHSESHQCSRRHDGAVPAPEDRPVDPTPVHTVDLPATPQRDRTIPATAWIEAPPELLALGTGSRPRAGGVQTSHRTLAALACRTSGEGQRSLRRAGGRRSARQLHVPPPPDGRRRGARPRRCGARAVPCRGRRLCATTLRGDVRCDLDAE